MQINEAGGRKAASQEAIISALPPTPLWMSHCSEQRFHGRIEVSHMGQATFLKPTPPPTSSCAACGPPRPACTMFGLSRAASGSSSLAAAAISAASACSTYSGYAGAWGR